MGTSGACRLEESGDGAGLAKRVRACDTGSMGPSWGVHSAAVRAALGGVARGSMLRRSSGTLSVRCDAGTGPRLQRASRFFISQNIYWLATAGMCAGNGGHECGQELTWRMERVGDWKCTRLTRAQMSYHKL